MLPALSFLLFLLLLPFAAAASAAIDPSYLFPPVEEVCEDFMKLSPCLRHLEAPPNFPLPKSPSACCKAIFALRSPAACFHYFVRHHFLLGYTVNDDLVSHLFLVCSRHYHGRLIVYPHCFHENCEGLEILPLDKFVSERSSPTLPNSGKSYFCDSWSKPRFHQICCAEKRYIAFT